MRHLANSAERDHAPDDREIFKHAWVCVGRGEDLPAPGAWLCAPVTAAGVLVVRQADLALRAFHAVCTHRGAAFIDQDEGAAARFTCKHHGFAFELDGTACAQSADLAPVRVEVAHGFVFVTLDHASVPLADALGEMPPWFADAELAGLRRARRVAYEVEARWTVVVEDLQAGLTPEEDRRVVREAMRFPNLLASLQPDSLRTFTVFPIDAGRTRVVASTYVDAKAPESTGSGSQRHCGIFGKPYVDLRELIDTSSFAAMHDEITRGLAVVETGYTGGSLKWMGVCAPWVVGDGYLDAMHCIRAMSKDELVELVALRDDHEGGAIDLEDPELAFGDETDRPFSRAQMRFLEQRYGVYFPWKVCYHLLENDRWEDKHSGQGKGFSAEARAVFPQTATFIESLPFVEIGRVVVFGLLANDHAPDHRDSEPGKALAVAHSISFDPGRCAPAAAGRHKRFYLATPDGKSEIIVDSPVYWFNDMDWHGVHADPFFRYSVRVDGVFEPDFLERIRRAARPSPNL